MLKTFALSVTAALALALPASAAVVMDQSSLPGDGVTPSSHQVLLFAPGAPNPPYGFGQSFTVGVTGRLDSLALALINNTGAAQDVKLTIYQGVPDLIYRPALYTTTFSAPVFDIPLNTYTPWTALPTIDLSAADLQVTANQVLTFVLTTTSAYSGLGLMGYVSGGPFTYAGGDKYSVGYGYLGKLQPYGGDFGFRTFVDTGGAVPEPATWAMLITGFALAGVALRRRSSQGESARPA